MGCQNMNLVPRGPKFFFVLITRFVFIATILNVSQLVEGWNLILDRKNINDCGPENLVVQVSLALRRGYFPDKFQTANTKTDILTLS